MAPQKENKIMHWIQTIMLSVTTAGIIWVGSTMVELKVMVSNHEGEQAHFRKEASEMRSSIDQLEQSSQNHEGRLIMLEAINNSKRK